MVARGRPSSSRAAAAGRTSTGCSRCGTRASGARRRDRRAAARRADVLDDRGLQHRPRRPRPRYRRRGRHHRHRAFRAARAAEPRARPRRRGRRLPPEEALERSSPGRRRKRACRALTRLVADRERPARRGAEGGDRRCLLVDGAQSAGADGVDASPLRLLHRLRPEVAVRAGLDGGAVRPRARARWVALPATSRSHRARRVVPPDRGRGAVRLGLDRPRSLAGFEAALGRCRTGSSNGRPR